MAKTSIEWTSTVDTDGTSRPGMTWNPTTGCDLLSAGCDHCYAKTMSHRLMLMGQPKYKNDFKLTLHPDTLQIPFQWKQPQTVFVDSMSDLFHHDVPLAYIQQVVATMRATHWHRYQVLTKRSGRLLALTEKIDWPENVWMGVSCESTRVKARIDHLRKTQARIKFVSFEPLLEPLGTLDLTGISWAIVGAESGHGARPMEEDWVRAIRDQCLAAGTAFFYKQKLVKGRKVATPELDGQVWKQFPIIQNEVEVIAHARD
jgi:protein gp37